MSKHDDRVSLQDMLDRGREAISLLGDIERESLASERVLQLALIQLVQIIGEAATRVSHETRLEFTEIPWPQIIGMRNRLIHGYDVIDYGLLWDTIRHDLPDLIVFLEKNINKK
jgi:uncharacterized protein with HEPN domain